MCENFKNENLIIIVCCVVFTLIIVTIVNFRYWGYVTIKKCKNSEDTVIQNIITKQYYKSYNDHYGMVFKKKINNYKIK